MVLETVHAAHRTEDVYSGLGHVPYDFGAFYVPDEQPFGRSCLLVVRFP